MAISKNKKLIQITLPVRQYDFLEQVTKINVEKGRTLTKSQIIETALDLFINTLTTMEGEKSKCN